MWTIIPVKLSNRGFDAEVSIKFEDNTCVGSCIGFEEYCDKKDDHLLKNWIMQCNSFKNCLGKPTRLKGAKRCPKCIDFVKKLQEEENVKG